MMMDFSESVGWNETACQTRLDRKIYYIETMIDDLRCVFFGLVCR